MEELSNLPFQHIILTPGNHDRILDKNCYDFDKNCLDFIKHHPRITYLVNDEVVININDAPKIDANSNFTKIPDSIPKSSLQQIKLYASPTVCYRNSSVYSIEDQKPIYAHAMERGSLEISENWKKIPSDTDILVTHGPPLGVADMNKKYQNCGCANLLKEVVDRVKPKVHVFGHIHECAGEVWRTDDTVFVNAGVLDHEYVMHSEKILSFEVKL